MQDAFVGGIVGMSYFAVAKILTNASRCARLVVHQMVGRFDEHHRGLQEVPDPRGLHFLS